MVKTASSKVGRGVVYVDVPACNDNLDEEFGVAFGALKAFKRGAKVYKAKHGRPAVIVYDNVSQLIPKHPGILDTLQDDAKKSSDDHLYIAVFVSSEGVVPRRVESRSSWSRAKNPPIEIGDLNEEESIKYLTEIHKITEKAEELYQLVGGRILELKDVATDFLSGQSIEDIREKILLEPHNKLNSAKILEGQKHHEAGKRVIDALLRSKEINIDEFRKLFANEEEYGETLEANMFAFHPSINTVGFQSQSIEYYIRKNYDGFADLVSLSSNYASTSKS
ncbi:10740_t:CDS:2 [Acaulospora morrowiae]|uniref:10740_t:CDS:1 n=1 Tax=Acaulospora morrowiae TaxID=94023 RepID=A0A9N9G0P0_9GLOM|nr:10740_t:CDS:2 [Acaulospora morrowiae]